MTSAVFLGVPPKSSQVVSAELKSRGIPLLRAAPSEVKPLILSNAPPNYGIYKHSLSSFVRAAETGTAVLMSDPYHLFSWRQIPSFAKHPRVVWNFNTPPAPESRDHMKQLFDADDTIAKGKPALVAVMSTKSVQDLVTQFNPVQTTPGSTSSINIQAYKQYLLLHRLFDTVCRTHQYAYNMKEFDQRQVEIDEQSLESNTIMATEETGTLGKR